MLGSVHLHALNKSVVWDFAVKVQQKEEKKLEAVNLYLR